MRMTAAIQATRTWRGYTAGMRLRRAIIIPCLAVGALLPVHVVLGQDVAPEVVIPQENVRYDYAQVLAVDPVYQVLRTSRQERVCDPAESSGWKGLAKVVGTVKGTFAPAGETDSKSESNCRMVAVTRDFRRPIAYDVDYVYKGSKFRTRMARDPGNRLRLRVSITPQPVPVQ